jgi:hypothetical protein
MQQVISLGYKLSLQLIISSCSSLAQERILQKSSSDRPPASDDPSGMVAAPACEAVSLSEISLVSLEVDDDPREEIYWRLCETSNTVVSLISFFSILEIIARHSFSLSLFSRVDSSSLIT